MNALRKIILKSYLRFHWYFHKRIIAMCAVPLFGGLHPCNVFEFRSDFFKENVNKNDVVIDIACGTGLLLSKIAPFIKKGYGIERFKPNLDFCNTKHRAENVEYVEEDIFKVDYEEFKKKTGYTTAIFSHILEHIEDAPAFISKVNADKLLISVPSQENWHTQLLMYFGLPYFKDATHFREYTREMLRKELALASYSIDFIGFDPDGNITCKATKKTL